MHATLDRSLYPALGIPLSSHVVRYTAEHGWVSMPVDFPEERVTREALETDPSLRFIPFYEIDEAQRAATYREMLDFAAVWFDRHTTELNGHKPPVYLPDTWVALASSIRVSGPWDPFVGVISFSIPSNTPVTLYDERELLRMCGLPTYASIVRQLGLDEHEQLFFVYL